ncbi:hypothetical protein BDK92_1124 [Micromonospora pisi]|uniref:SWIM-type domain-containing protein n=1 Tax=Micromonospora pisi TaxID=589240 RepID=A0A495JCW5_9ACTN|nr:hypothetical protein [Micromonospora pisi]RKR86856.1 hypothetical protein BDK92_1124 [Micromonospora pisi]
MSPEVLPRSRPDLLALTPEALAALTNRGLVKRAAKEVDQAPPTVQLDPDGTVRGRFADAIVTSLPTGGLDTGSCNCGAIGTCRHLVALILTYQRQGSGTDAGDDVDPGVAAGGRGAGERAAAVLDWSPGSFTDEVLAARIGTRLLAVARRAERAGYVARVRRASATDPVPQVELSTATVRFLVPYDLGFVHSDVVAGARDDVIALAVWAFRVADATVPGVPEAQVEVGGVPAATMRGTGLEPALELADAVLRDGAVHLGPGISAVIADVRRQLDAAGLRWPLLAVDDLAAQLTAYHDRSNRYRPDLLAGLLAELHARHRAVVNDGASPRSRVLGTEEPAETPLRRVRLDSLGCRVLAIGDERVAEVFYAHADSSTILVLRRAWTGAEDGPALANRRVGGATLGALANGVVVTESAVRSASRTIRLATSRIARTTVGPSPGHWDRLPQTMTVMDFAVLSEELTALPPAVVRPRVEAELVRAVQIAEIRSLRYSPGHQRLDAVVADRAGNTATITATHAAVTPGRLDTIAATLRGAHGPVRYVSGAVSRNGGELLVEPFAFAVDGRLVVPDLAPAQSGTAVAEIEPNGPDALADTVREQLELLAEVAHRGLAHLPTTFTDRLRGSAHTLSTMGMRRIGDAVARFAETLGPDRGEEAARAWVDAYLRLSLAAELC